MDNYFPRLVADIGGTYARLSIEKAPFEFHNKTVLKCADYTTFAELFEIYINSLNLNGRIIAASIAIPSPVIDDYLFMINSPWEKVSITEIKNKLKIKHIIFLNDFHALALSLPFISNDNLISLSDDFNHQDKPKVVIGPGTGLGMATLLKHPITSYCALSAEGGRSTFTPVDDIEIELLKIARNDFNHVSVERFVSGPGIKYIYNCISKLENNRNYKDLSTSEISLLAINNQDDFALKTLHIFCNMLGTISSNLAVMTNAFGGVYIGGGVIPKILDFFLKSNFRNRFISKGRYEVYLSQIPISVIIDKYAAFLGASYALDTYLKENYIP